MKRKKSTTTSQKKLFRRTLPSLLILLWVVVAGIGGPFFGKLSEKSSTDIATFLPKNAESSLASKEIEKFNDRRGVPLVIVFEKNNQELTTNDVSDIKAVNSKLNVIESVKGPIASPVIAEDNKAAISIVPLATDSDFIKTFPAIKKQLADAKLPVSYTLTGPASFSHDLQGGFSGIDSTLLLVTVAFVFAILLAVYRSPLLPIIVLFSAMAALSVAVVVVYYLADIGFVQINGQVQGILFILVIGAATDYSLLYISRYREELTQHRLVWRAAVSALRASLPAILAAGGTVSVGLLCLIFSDLGSNKALGPVGGIGIALSVLSAITLLPSLLLLSGRAAFWPVRPKYANEEKTPHYLKNHRIWAHIGAFVKRYPRPIWMVCTVVLIAASFGITQLKAEGVPQGDILIGKSEARDGQKILDKHFPAGSGSPAYIIASKDRQSEIVTMLDNDKGVSSVSIASNNVESGAAPIGNNEATIRSKIVKTIENERNKHLESLRTQISLKMAGYPQSYIDREFNNAANAIPSIDSLVANAYPFKDAVPKQVDNEILLQAILSDPADSLPARDTIIRIRDNLKQIDSSAKVGGVSASQLDTSVASKRDITVIVPLILISITVILMALLRSIAAPLVLLVSTILSFSATMGIAALVFNNVWNFAGADPTVIILGFVFLVALGIDYNIFLMTRVREETVRLGVSRGTVKGLVVTGGVITSAGIVLAATFAALNVIPVLYLVEISFIVTFGVLLDTIIVRSLLVPAVTLEIGRTMWWPSKLSKRKK